MPVAGGSDGSGCADSDAEVLVDGWVATTLSSLLSPPANTATPPAITPSTRAAARAGVAGCFHHGRLVCWSMPDRICCRPSSEGVTMAASEVRASRSRAASGHQVSVVAEVRAHREASRVVRRAAMPRDAWLFTAPRLMPMASAMSASARST